MVNECLGRTRATSFVTKLPVYLLYLNLSYIVCIMKSLFSKHLVLSVFLAFFAFNGFAFDDYMGLKYRVISKDSHTAALYGISASTSVAEMEIPSSVYNKEDEEYYTIVQIDDNTFYQRGCRHVTIPNTVRSIGANAFRSNPNLSKVILGNSVVSIGAGAFYDCSAMWIEPLTIPASVQIIGANAFSNCNTEISLDSRNTSFVLDSGILYNADKSRILFCNYRCPNNVVIPNGVITMDDYAFERAENMASVDIPAGITSFVGAFYGCTNLKTIICRATTPPVIDVTAFNDATQEEGTLLVPQSSLQSYRTELYWKGFKNIDTYEMPNDEIWYTTTDNAIISVANSISNTYNNGIGKIKFSGPKTSIDKGIFNGQTRLKSITILPSVTSISQEAFSGCTSLTSVRFEDSDSPISMLYKTRKWCNNEDDDVTVTADIFKNCPIESLYIGREIYTNQNGNYTIGDDCTDGIDKWYGPEVFSDIKNTVKTIEIGKNVSKANYLSIFTHLASVTVNAGNQSLIVDGDALFNKDKSVLCSYWGGDEFIIPATVTAIQDSAFYNNDRLTLLHIPSHVTSFGLFSFYNVGGKLVIDCNIPNGKRFEAEKVGEWSYSYEGHSSGTYGYFSETRFSEITFGENVSEIGSYAFVNNTTIKKISCLSSSVVKNRGAFTYDMSKMCELYVPKGLKEEYMKYSNGWSNFTNIVEMLGSVIISATTSDNTMGSVTGGGEYDEDTEVTLTAIPTEGYEFVEWSDGSTENPYVFVANDNKNLTATFQPSAINHYAIKLFDEPLYLTTNLVPERKGWTNATRITYGLSTLAEPFVITTSADGSVIQSVTSDRYIGIGYGRWDLSNNMDCWDIADKEDGSVSILQHGRTIGLGVDTKEDSCGVFADKSNGKWQILKCHAANYIIDGEPYATYYIPEDFSIVTPQVAPEKEGHVFAGWDDVPDVMQTEDMTINGHFVPVCGTPSIAVADDEIVFTSSTPGAVFHYSITPATPQSESTSEDGHVRFIPTYDIVVYASAEGFANSETITFTIGGASPDTNRDGKITVSDVTEVIRVLLMQSERSE